MRVLGAAEPFTFGARAGAAGCFLARKYHASMPPRHLRRSGGAERWRLLQPQSQPLGRSRRSERRGAQHDAKQPPLHNHELMLMRQKVMDELNATNLNLAASGDRAVLGLVNTRAR